MNLFGRSIAFEREVELSEVIDNPEHRKRVRDLVLKGMGQWAKFTVRCKGVPGRKGRANAWVIRRDR